MILWQTFRKELIRQWNVNSPSMSVCALGLPWWSSQPKDHAGFELARVLCFDPASTSQGGQLFGNLGLEKKDGHLLILHALL